MGRSVKPKRRPRRRPAKRDEMLFEPLEPRTLLSVAGAEFLAFEAAVDHLLRPVQGDPADVVQETASSADQSFNPRDVLDIFSTSGSPGGDSQPDKLGHGEGDSGFSPGTTLDSFHHPTGEGEKEGSSGHVDSILDLPRLEGAAENPAKGESGGHLGFLMDLPRLEGAGPGESNAEEPVSEHAGALLDLPRFEEGGDDPSGTDFELNPGDFQPDRYGDFEAVTDMIDESAEHFRHTPSRFDFEGESPAESAGPNNYSNLRGPDIRYDPGYDGVGPGLLSEFGPGRFELAELEQMRSRFAGQHPDEYLRDIFAGEGPRFRSLAQTGDTFSPGAVIDAYHQSGGAEPEIGSAIGTLPRLEAELTPGAFDGANAGESLEFEEGLSAFDFFDPYADREDRYAEPYGSEGEHFRQSQAPASGGNAAQPAAAPDGSFEPGRVIETFHGSDAAGGESLGSAIGRMPDLEASADDHWRPASTDLRRFLRELGPRDEADEIDTGVDPVRSGKR